MYSRPVSRTLRPWKKRLARRLLPRRLARRPLDRRLARRRPPRRLARVLAAFFAARERAARFAARVRAAFFAAVDRFDALFDARFELRFDALFDALFDAVLLEARFGPFLLPRFEERLVPADAIVMPPSLADSVGREERRRGSWPVSMLRAAARTDCISELPR
jgi:hypothetical protein